MLFASDLKGGIDFSGFPTQTVPAAMSAYVGESSGRDVAMENTSNTGLNQLSTDVLWTMVVLPDTQAYQGFPAILQTMTNWIVANKDSRNIKLVLHEGDIVQDNIPGQWQIAKNALGTLDGQVPYVLATGNHDFGPSGNASNRNTLLNTYFQLSNNPLNNSATGIFTTQYIAGRMENSYSTLVAPDGRQLLVFALEFAPRQQVVDWANSVAGLPEFENATSVLLTHAYLEEGPALNGEPTALRSNWAFYGPNRLYNPHSYALANINPSDPVHDGEELWNELVGQHANFEMVLNGHYLDDTDTNPNGLMTTAWQTSVGVNGNSVHEIVFNSQQQPNGGNGYMRLMEFLNDGQTVQVRTYSPSLNLWLTDARNEFQLQLKPINLPLEGDFNGDGLYGCEDIDELVQKVSVASGDSRFDLTRDGSVNGSDIDFWLSKAGAKNLGPGRSFLRGDATLDGNVDGADFIRWNSSKFTNTPAWCNGDFNGDGFVDGQDFIIWNTHKFQSSDGNLVGNTGQLSATMIAGRDGKVQPKLVGKGQPQGMQDLPSVGKQVAQSGSAIDLGRRNQQFNDLVSGRRNHRAVPTALFVDRVMANSKDGWSVPLAIDRR